MKVISLFSGIGGLDFGFEAAGFETAVAVELDKTCCHTLRLNRKWSVIEGDIHSISTEQILKTAGLKIGEADVLIGGPPCQPFSKTGYWARGDALRLDDPRAGTLAAYLRVLKEAKPRAFLLENVPGLVFKGKDEGLQLLLDGIERVNKEVGTNYKVTWKVLNAAQFGVPQFRERVFLIASRDGRAFEFPSPTHGVTNTKKRLKPFRTTWDAIGDLEDDNSVELKMKGKWAELLPTIPEGQNYLFHTNRGQGAPLFGWRKRYWSFLLKLAKNQPSWTLQAQPGPAIGPFHWKSRRLSSKELCRLQTFPDDLQFDCPITSVQKMLGNAVPSLMAEVLAHAIREQLLDKPKHKKMLKLIPPSRSLIPDPELVLKVPSKYLHLEGDHEDHPGTGKGPGAILRLQESELVGNKGDTSKVKGSRNLKGENNNSELTSLSKKSKIKPDAGVKELNKKNKYKPSEDQVKNFAKRKTTNEISIT